MSAPPGPDFGPLAETYDALRPADASWSEVVDVLWEQGDLGARRVLDVGCGTGRLTAVLVERGALVSGVDPSAEMLSRAKQRLGSFARLSVGRAEELPFEDGSFERAILVLVVHLVDRPLALGEIARVLVPGGRLLIATFRPEHFDCFWLNRFFPSAEAIDRARFPAPADLARELEASGFEAVTATPIDQHRSVTRAAALERLHGRYISTLRLLPEREYRSGVALAERELEQRTRYSIRWSILVAERSSPPG